MIKKGSFRRMVVASFALFIVLLTIYIFPKDEVKIPSKTIYKKVYASAIYLIDKNNYVARTTVNISSTSKETKALELINTLINGTVKNKYIPSGFKSLIAEGTTVNNVKISGDLITIDFNQNFLNTKDIDEEKMIESIVYTLTEIKGIKKVKILVDGKAINKLPSSGKIIPDILTREIGINKKTSLTSFKNTKDVTTYFLNKIDDNKYFVPVTITTDDPSEKIEIIIKELKAKDNIDNNLSTYLEAGTTLKNYQVLENEFNMEFNNVILNSFNKIDEEVVYGLALSIYDNYNIDRISIDVDNVQVVAYALKIT